MVFSNATTMTTMARLQRIALDSKKVNIYQFYIFIGHSFLIAVHKRKENVSDE